MVYLIMFGQMMISFLIGIGYKSASLSTRNTGNLNNLFTAGWTGTIAVVVFLISILTTGFNPQPMTVVINVLGGFAFTFTVYFYNKALTIGPFTWTILIMNMTSFMAALFSIIVLKEPYTVKTILGIFVMVIAVSMLAINPGEMKNEQNGISLRWILYSALFFIGNSLLYIRVKLQAYFVTDVDNRWEYIFFTFLACSLSSLFLYFMQGGVKNLPSHNPELSPIDNKRRFWGAFISLALNQIANALIGLALTHYATGAMQFSIPTVGSIILSTLVGILYFHDKFSWKLVISTVLTCIGAMLL